MLETSMTRMSSIFFNSSYNVKAKLRDETLYVFKRLGPHKSGGDAAPLTREPSKTKPISLNSHPRISKEVPQGLFEGEHHIERDAVVLPSSSAKASIRFCAAWSRPWVRGQVLGILGLEIYYMCISPRFCSVSDTSDS